MSEAICPKFEKAMSMLSKRWVGLIIDQLLDGPKRFNELESAVKLSAKVLSERLKFLEEEGVVRREVIADTPVKITYELTEKGKSLRPLMDSTRSWAEHWL
ncbi:MAG: winged helix-turn-helix transcriptional regulator [Candidatus Izemoplasmataceae bacterium]